MKLKNTYHFLQGKHAVTKSFEAEGETPAAAKLANDNSAIAFGKSKKGVIRVQCDATRKHIYENLPKAQQPKNPEDLLDEVLEEAPTAVVQPKEALVAK